MVNIKNKKCVKCDTSASYGLLSKGVTHCAEHKEPNMVDIKHKKCVKCDTLASYGLLSKGVTHCAKHKTNAMITSPNKKCHCGKIGVYELDDRYCENHAPANSQNLGIFPCGGCGLDAILTDGKCETCHPEARKKYEHAKEIQIKDVLTAAGFKFIHDKMLEGPSCGRERPDFQIDCGTHFIYVEVDEHQHANYACECEQIRMINLTQVRHMPVRWIRYNPDVYEGRRYTREQREKKLVDTIKWAQKHIPTVAEVIYLYYDHPDFKWHMLS
jgi:hypothetical protein